jgi:hypothetical protein
LFDLLEGGFDEGDAANLRLASAVGCLWTRTLLLAQLLKLESKELLRIMLLMREDGN